MIIDTHAHYDDHAFDEDRNELLNSMQAVGIHRIVNIGASMNSCKKTLRLMEEYDFLYGAIGVHPSECGELTDEDIKWIKEQCQLEKVVAVGEIGLDYYWPEPDREIQKKWFPAQLQIARECKLPVVIHSRDAAKDTLDIMKAEKAGEIGGVVHCYSYSKEVARDYLDMDFFFGIGGVVTFNNGRKLKEVVEYIPLDKIVLETDCPYLAPVPFRGKRNDSTKLVHVVEEIATIKGVDTETVIAKTFENAMCLYPKLK